MFAGSDQVQIFAFNFIHHSFHFIEAHNAGYYVATNHEGRDAIGKTALDHEITCIRNYSRMQTCNIAHQVIEAIAGYFTSAVQIDAMQIFHNFGMIGNVKFRNHWLAKALQLYVLAIIFTDRNTGINNIGQSHHDLFHFLRQFGFHLLQLCQACRSLGHLLLHLLSLFLQALRHQTTDLFRDLVTVCTKIICLLFHLTAFGIQLNYLINHRQFAILELIANILLNDLRIFSDKFQI